MAGEIGRLFVSVFAKTDEFNRQISGVKSQLSSLSKAALPASQAVAKMFTVAAVAAGGLVIGSIKVAAELETVETGFRVLLGSGEAASKMMKDLQDFAATTPFQFPQLAEGARLLAAFGFEAESIIPNMRMLGDVSAAVNMPVQELAELYGKAKVQGRLFMEDINQLTGRGIPIIGELAKIFGVTEGEIRDLVSTGQVGFEHIEQAFINMTSEGGKFEGMMVEMSQTIGGKWSTFKDNLTLTMQTIGTAIIEGFDLKGVLDRLTAGTAEIMKKFQSAADLIKEVGIKEAIDMMFSEQAQWKVILFAGALAGALVPALWAVATAAIAAMIPLIPFILIGMAIAGLAFLIYKNWEKIGPMLAGIWEPIKAKAMAIWGALQAFWEQHGEAITQVFQAAWDQVVNIFKTVFAIIGGIIAFWKAVFTGDVSGAMEAAKGIFSTAWNFIVGSVRNFASALGAVWSTIKSAASSAWSGIVSAIRAKANEIRTSVINAVNSAISWLKGLPGQMVSIGRNIVQGIINGIRNMGSALSGALKGIVDSAIRKVKSLLGLKSPSKLFEGFGENVGQGFINGIASMQGAVSGAMGGMVTPDIALAGGGGTMTIRHEVDLRNVPASVDVTSLEGRLMDMLNNPQIKRRLDRVNYENTVATRGLGV